MKIYIRELGNVAHLISGWSIVAIFYTFCTCKMHAQHQLFDEDTSLIRLSSDYAFTEGPAADAHGNVYFTDQPNDRILKWNPDRGISVFMENTGRANGLYFDKNGNLLACADEDNQLWRISPEREVEVLVSRVQGKRLNGPNDLWVDSNGGIYFTDPYYKRGYWTHSEKEIDRESVYYLDPEGKLQVVADDFVKPNGIIGSPDGQVLFVADIGDSKTYSYQINSDGKLSGKKLFVEMGSDGMTLDSRGNLYLTGNGVTIVDPTGKIVAKIEVAEPWTANVCFGGKDKKTLFITAMKSVYILEMNVRGVF